MQRRPDWDRLNRETKAAKAEEKSADRAWREKKARTEALRQKADTQPECDPYQNEGDLGFKGESISFRMVGVRKPPPLPAAVHDWTMLPYADRWQKTRICTKCGAKSGSVAASIACPGHTIPPK